MLTQHSGVNTAPGYGGAAHPAAAADAFFGCDSVTLNMAVGQQVA